MLIEVFRAGSPAAIAAGITAADLADVAAFDCANNPVPNVIGHPMTNSPANGSVVKFEAKGDKLFAEVPEKLPAFRAVVDKIKSGEILNRSMAFFGKRHPSNPTPGKVAPMHLGWLGGAVPGIAGLPALASYFAANPDSAFTFAADGETMEAAGAPMDAVVVEPAEPATGVVVITDQAPPAPISPAAPAPTQEASTMTAEEIKAAADQIAKDRKDHDDRVAAFAAQQQTAREQSNASTVDALVAANKVLPADKADLVAAFNAVDDGNVIAFASDAAKPKASPVSIIAAIMSKGGPVSPAGEAPLSPSDAPTFAAGGDNEAALKKAREERMAKYGK